MSESIRFWFEPEEFETLPDVVKTANKNRIKFLKFSWGASAVIAVAGFVFTVGAGIHNGGFMGLIKGIFSGIFQGIIGGIFAGSWAYGIYLWRHLYGVIAKIIKASPIIILSWMMIAFMILPFGAVFMFSAYLGWAFVIADTVLYIKKKPLIHKKEAQRIINKSLGLT